MPEHAQDAWLDSPDVLRVAFHPRREGPSRAAAGFEVLDIPVGDAIIPVADAEALFRAGGSASKRLLKFDGAGHNNLLALAMDEYMQAVAELVGTVGGRR